MKKDFSYEIKESKYFINQYKSIFIQVHNYKNKSLLSDLKKFDKMKYYGDGLNEIVYSEYNSKVLIELVKTYYKKDISEELNKLSNVQTKNKEVKDDYKNIKLPEIKSKIKLYEHQLDAIKFGLDRNSFLLGDEMGLGKTASSIHYAIAKKKESHYKHCLIISGINGLKFNWLNEIEKVSEEKGIILGARNNRKGQLVSKGSKEILEDLKSIARIKEYFLITNIQSLRNKRIVELLVSLIIENYITMIILDEAQAIKDPTTQQAKGLLKLRAKTKVAITGTPFMNRPIELYSIFNWLDVDKHSYYAFRNHYCVMGGYKNYEIVGYKNLDELQGKLDEVMIRRLKKDLLDLPEKIYKVEYLELGNEQQKIYNEIRDEILQRVDQIKLDPNPLASFTRLRQATAFTSILSSSVDESVKLERISELVSELKANNRKTVIFSNWSVVADKLEEELKKQKISTYKITGKIKQEERMDIIKDFAEKGDVLIGTIGAVGTGFNLTMANTVIFFDEPYNRALKEQAEDRCHRIGTKESTEIITLVCKSTIDEKINNLVYKKGVMFDALVDKEIELKELNKLELIDYLLKD